MNMGFFESARRGHSEKSSFAMYLVQKKIDNFQLPKTILGTFGTRFHCHHSHVWVFASN